MSTTKNDGGPAFPTHHNVNDPRSDGFCAEEGMKLRDYFAGQVASGVIAACRGDTTNEGETTEQMLVRKVWAFADAMLEARQ